MSYIDEILKEVVNANCPLINPLLKTKLLAKKLKNDKLLTWVNSELNGYKAEDDLPKYRKLNGYLSGKGSNDGRTVYLDLPVPMTYLTKDTIELISRFPFYQSIGALEKMGTESDPTARLQVNLVSFCGTINSELRDNGSIARFMDLNLSVHKDIIHQIITVIRSTLIDLFSELEDYEIDLDNLKDKPVAAINQTIYQIMEQKNITSIGDGNVNNTGSDNNFKIDITVKKNDIESLKEYFLKNKVSVEDISGLELAIKEDTPDKEAKEYGPKVNGWMGKMVSKAAKGSWQIGAAAAGKLLADGLGAYYGF